MTFFDTAEAYGPFVNEELLGEASIELTNDDLREIESAVSKVDVQGARYPAHLQARVGR